VKIGQGAVGSHEKAPPEHRVDSSNPGVDQFTDIKDIKKEMFQCLEIQFENWLNS
jgi:hypothetical protein